MIRLITSESKSWRCVMFFPLSCLFNLLHFVGLLDLRTSFPFFKCVYKIDRYVWSKHSKQTETKFFPDYSNRLWTSAHLKVIAQATSQAVYSHVRLRTYNCESREANLTILSILNTILNMKLFCLIKHFKKSVFFIYQQQKII